METIMRHSVSRFSQSVLQILPTDLKSATHLTERYWKSEKGKTLACLIACVTDVADVTDFTGWEAVFCRTCGVK